MLKTTNNLSFPNQLRIDPLTNREICRECWNNHHDKCVTIGCKCMHRDKPRRSKLLTNQTQ